jgi:myo-inositol-1-phosphate synthase
MAPNFTSDSSGYNTPASELESIIQIHPTAARRPHSILVQSENTVYTDEHITAKYLNRGADVTVSDGQFNVTPTVQPFEFRTTRKVGKTGQASRCLRHLFGKTNDLSPVS